MKHFSLVWSLSVSRGHHILAPVLAPHDPTAIHASDGLAAPSSTYLLGTDNLGRDILSRIIYAARTSLLVALGSVLVAGVIGVPLGLIAGYAGGKIDSVIMRVLDAILAFPVILLAILVVATLGTQTINLILTIGFVFIPYFTRLVRGNVLMLKEREFVAASRASGADDRYLVTRVILPNILSPIVLQASLTMSLAVLIEAALSFLGLGVRSRRPLGAPCCRTHSSTCARPPGSFSHQASAFSSPFWPSTSSAMDCATYST